MASLTSSSPTILLGTIKNGLYGNELVKHINNICGITTTTTSRFGNWLLATDTLKATWGSLRQHEAVVVVVETGTCYAGTRMMLFWYAGGPHAILLDKDYGFDVTTPAVTEEGYAMYDRKNPTTDNVKDVNHWFLISKAHQSDPMDYENSRFGRLLKALNHPQYQQPVGTPLGRSTTIRLKGWRYSSVPQCVMCKTLLHKLGGHADCTLPAYHDSDHLVQTRRNGLVAVPRIVPGITEGGVPAQQSTGVLPGPVRQKSEDKKNDAASVMMSLNGGGSTGAPASAGKSAGDGNSIAVTEPASAAAPTLLRDGEESALDTQLAEVNASIQQLEMERKQRIEKKRKELEVLKALEATLKKRAAAEEEASKRQRTA